MVGELLTCVDANDAFTQAVTNPLLARSVFNEATFTKTGIKEALSTRSWPGMQPRRRRST
jgi:prostaglandin-endoperoxide synthase 2